LLLALQSAGFASEEAVVVAQNPGHAAGFEGLPREVKVGRLA
jgi:hypothetical protein